MSEPDWDWVGEFVGGPLDGKRQAFLPSVHTMQMPMMVRGRAGIWRGRYVRTKELTGDGAAWRMLWNPPA